MSAWYRFTRLMVWLLLPLITCFSLRAQSSDIKNALRLEKLDGYSHIAATTIFHWNTPSNVSNTDITVMIDESVLLPFSCTLLLRFQVFLLVAILH